MNVFSFEKNFAIEKKFAIALYTYLRQAELSTHRGMGQWGDLREYYNTQAISPEIVVATVKNRFKEYLDQFSNQTLSRDHFQEIQTGIFAQLYRFWNWHFKNRLILRKNEFWFIFQSLLEVEEVLATVQPSPEYVVSIRQDLCVSWEIIEQNVPFCDFCKRAKYIRHFNQNEHLVLFSFSEIVDERYLKMHSGDH